VSQLVGWGHRGSSELLGHLRHRDEEVSNESKVGHLEDGGLGVLVDAGDHLGVLHTGQVLDGSGNTDGNVQLGGDDLAGLTDLHRNKGIRASMETRLLFQKKIPEGRWGRSRRQRRHGRHQQPHPSCPRDRR